MQNEMHSQRRQSDWLFRKLREVMIEECYQYRNSEQPQLDAVFNAKQWEQFVNMAQSKIRISKQCLASLVRTAEYWGMNKVQYYEWASMGVKYCDVLVTAASQNPVWEEARVKLNQLLLRRIAEGRFLRTTANPIYLLDLEHLIAWTDKTNFEKRGRRAYTLKYEPITESDLPVGYGLDQFGLIVTKHQIICTKARMNSRQLQQPHLTVVLLNNVLVAGKPCRLRRY
ncbi:hypothetical protein A1F94_007263 [Pyrenophora tritici-repentis]|nr:hypothetical protein A1F94_007263 [Pyrenophora tritici-repentis]